VTETAVSAGVRTSGGPIEFRLLGEAEMRAAGQMLDVGAPRLQVVLAALAVDPGRPVAIETLIDRVWDGNPPVEVRNVLYSYLSRIRRLLRQAATLTGESAVRIERRHAGYVLDIDPDLVDLHRFRRLVDRGRDRGCADDARAAALAEALDLWRGSPLAGLPGEWVAQVRDSWHRQRLDAVVQWAHLELRLGHPVAVIAALPDLAAEYPLVEPLEALLIRALHTAGRSAEALTRYSVVRQRLADELGTDPGPELRALHQALLRGELPPPTVAAVKAASPPPQLTASPTLAVAAGAPPRRAGPRLTRRRAVLAALVAVIPLAAGSVFVLDRGEEVGSPPSIERAQALFAKAQRLDREGKVKAAHETIVDAVHLYDELIKLDPEKNPPLLATAIIEALGRAGVDFSVAETALRSWFTDPAFTPYPAISQVFLLQGWRLKAPVYLDVIVWNYDDVTGGHSSPRKVADVRSDALKAAIVAGSNTRYGTGVTDFAQLLKA
jgi:DNA-binding SARP family transcriptional activator